MSRSRTLLSVAALLWGSSVIVTAGWDQAPVPVRTEVAGASSGDPAMFAPSSECLACHNNLVAPSGEDISIGASWRGSMMANAARDPYFFASVRREVLDHPSRQAHIEDECAACHLPAAQKIARAGGSTGRVFAFAPRSDAVAQSALERLAVDGVSCTVCHQIARDRLGTPESFNGNFVVAAPRADGRRRVLGPYLPDPGRARLMHSVTGFEQEEAPHIRESEVCATCHTLITEAFGQDGRVIGSLHEQKNYQEWQHSAFNKEERSCQSCHMPRAQGPVRASSVLGDSRDQLAQHVFVGGNAFMVRMLSRYRTELGVTALPSELESTARATLHQLQNETATIALGASQLHERTLSFDVDVRNLTGHKFPTGYPSRRTWLHVTVRNRNDTVVFESGAVQDSGAIRGNDNDVDPARYEPHYEQISDPGEVQIYEPVLGNPAGGPTTGLLTATQYLKDNRLLPRGFEKSTASPEIGVYGRASSDADFTGGGDRTRYVVDVDGSGPYKIEAELRYQTIGYRWAHNLSDYNAAEPRQFLSYFRSMSSVSSVVIAAASTRTDQSPE